MNPIMRSEGEIEKFSKRSSRLDTFVIRRIEWMRHLCLFIILAITFAISMLIFTAGGEANYSSARSATELYKKHCASCHGKDGRGKTFKGKLTHARDLTDRNWQDDTSDERFFNSIMKGKNKMPGFSKKLSSAEIDALVSYVRALK